MFFGKKLKKLYFVLLMCLVSPSAFAGIGQILLDTRFDFQSFSANEAAAKPAYSVFKFNRLRLDMNGTLGVDTSFKMRINLLNNSQSPSTRENVSSFIDYALVSRYLTDNLNLVAGKYITSMGGVEGTYSVGDLYFRSIAGDEVAKIYYPTGAQLEGQMGYNKIKLNIGNVTEDVKDASGNLTNTSFLYGFTYTAKFFDGLWSPNLSYHTESLKTAATVPVKKDRSYMAIGSKFSYAMFEADLDYLLNKGKYDLQAADDVLETNSLVGVLRYKFLEASSVQFKYEDSSQKKAISATDDKKTKTTGMGLAYEFKPFKDENWRAHIAGTQKNVKPKDADTKIEKNIYVGMRILADFLK